VAFDAGSVNLRVARSHVWPSSARSKPIAHWWPSFVPSTRLPRNC